MKYELLVLDIDGTLVNSKGDISAEDRAALALAREWGVAVSICTGRSQSSQKFDPK